jgi:hypothetical protein
MPVSAQKKKSSKIIPKAKDKVKFPLYCYCSFCRKPSESVKRLITGPNNIFICDNCLEIGVRILLEDDYEDWKNRLTSILAKKQKEVEKSNKRKVKKTNAN